MDIQEWLEERSTVLLALRETLRTRIIDTHGDKEEIPIQSTGLLSEDELFLCDEVDELMMTALEEPVVFGDLEKWEESNIIGTSTQELCKVTAFGVLQDALHHPPISNVLIFGDIHYRLIVSKHFQEVMNKYKLLIYALTSQTKEQFIERAADYVAEQKEQKGVAVSSNDTDTLENEEPLSLIEEWEYIEYSLHEVEFLLEALELQALPQSERIVEINRRKIEVSEMIEKTVELYRYVTSLANCRTVKEYKAIMTLINTWTVKNAETFELPTASENVQVSVIS